MNLCVSTSSHLQSTKSLGQGAIRGGPQRQSPLTASIHMLDDDSLLYIFYHYRPFLLGEEDEGENRRMRLFGGTGRWDRGRWWYKLAHVCQRWRNIVLGSTAHLGISLVCANGTPVADMLAHSSPLPLVIDYACNEITAEDEDGAILSLEKYDRVRRVRLWTAPTSLQKLIAAMDDEYPILEYLIIWHPLVDETTMLIFPETLQAPHLRHLALVGFTLPMESRLLTTAVGLVTLCLGMINPSSYFHPNTLLQWVSFMPRLETLVISFILFPVHSHHVEGQLTHTAITIPVTLPSLLTFTFKGTAAYLEAILHRISAPRLEKLQIAFFHQLMFSVPRLLHFVDTTEKLKFKSAKLEFSDENVDVEVYPYEEAKIYSLSITVDCLHLDWQVSSAAQISNSLSPTFSAVENLTIKHSVHSQSSEEHNEADRTEWRKLLGSFKNVKTLRIAKGLVEELSRCLGLDDGELPLELLPELQELTYSRSGDIGDVFTSFVKARQDAGRSVTLLRRSPSPDPSLRAPSAEPSPTIPENGEAGSGPDAQIQVTDANQRANNPSPTSAV